MIRPLARSNGWLVGAPHDTMRKDGQDSSKNALGLLGLAVSLATNLVAAPVVADAQVVRFAVRVFEAWAPDPSLPPTRIPAPDAPAAPEPEAQIRWIIPQLRRLFRYTEYRKVAQLRAEGPIGMAQSFEFPGNCSLEITPVRLLDKGIQMRVLLREKGRVGLHTGLLAPAGSPAIVGGPAYGDGVLVIVFWARPTAPLR
jgi:hypothetical protein